MRILQLGDTHLGTSLRTLGGPEGWSRSDDHHTALEAALAPALAGEVDLVLHTGDVFNRSRPPPAVVHRAQALFERVARRVPVVLVAGNHDRRGLSTHFGTSRGALHIVDSPTRLRVAGLSLVLVPHIRRAEDWVAAVHPLVRGGVDALVCHQGFAGCHVPGFTFRVGRPEETVGEQHLPPDPIGAVLSGHIHPRQTVRWGPHQVVYAGSTERTSRSEAHQTKGSVIWSLGAAWTHRFVDGPARPWMDCQSEADLSRVRQGDLVSVKPAQLARLGEAVVARGGRLVLPRSRSGPPRRQVRLF